MAIRVMKAALDELRMQFRDVFEPVVMGDNFGFTCDTFPDFPLCIQWDPLMPMDSPGRYIEPTTVNLDFRGVLRAKLQEDVDLTGCTLLLCYGNIQPENYEDKTVFLITPPADATHALLTINWPVGKPPFYDTALTGRFATKYGAAAYARHEPGKEDSLTPDDCGSDQWLLRMDALGEVFRQAAVEYDEVEEALVNSLWEDFDLKKAYYRQQFEQYEREVMTPLHVGLKYYDDYIELKLSSETERFVSASGRSRPRMWYCESHFMALQEAVEELRITIGYASIASGIGSIFGGPRSPFGESGMFGDWLLS